VFVNKDNVKPTVETWQFINVLTVDRTTQTRHVSQSYSERQ